MTLRHLLLTHTDMDGAACEAIARVWIPGITCKRCDYSEIDEAVRVAVEEDWDRIVLSDICCSEATLAWLQDKGHLRLYEPETRITICDHHANNIWARQGPGLPAEHGLYLADGCGAEALLLWLRRDGIPDGDAEDAARFEACRKFAFLVGVYDIWRIEHRLRELSERFQLLFSFLGYRLFVFRCMVKLLQGIAHELTDEEQSIVFTLEERQERYVKGRLKAAQVETDSGGRTFRWVCANRHTSAVGHALAKGYDYAAVWCPEYGTVQLRSSEGGANVGQIAKARGGGGHDHAAGYPCPGVPGWVRE